jgi:hypothetical protein
LFQSYFQSARSPLFGVQLKETEGKTERTTKEKAMCPPRPAAPHAEIEGSEGGMGSELFMEKNTMLLPIPSAAEKTRHEVDPEEKEKQKECVDEEGEERKTHTEDNDTESVSGDPRSLTDQDLKEASSIPTAPSAPVPPEAANLVPISMFDHLLHVSHVFSMLSFHRRTTTMHGSSF